MRICELNLLAFGIFTDTLLDLTSGEAGLQIIFGPNESGKTTSLRAIPSLLFGFSHTAQDGFLHPKPKVAGTLQSCSGKEISFIRRKGRKNTLLHPVTEAAVPDSELHAFLGGVDRDTFESVFAIDHARMVRGGDELRQLRGLVGESLYTSALGGARLATVLTELTEEAQGIFDTRKKCRIRNAEKEFKQALQEKKEATIPFSRWERLQKELVQVTAARQQTTNEIQALRIEEKRTERIRRSLRLLATRSQLLDQSARIGAVELLPDGYSTEARIRAESELAQVKHRLATLRERLDGEQGLHRQQQALPISTLLLESEALIRDLQERLGAHLKAHRDCDAKLRPQLEQRVARIARLHADLHTGTSSTEIDRLRIASNRILGIQNLASEEKQIRSEPGRLATRRRDLERALGRSRRQLQDLGEIKDTGRLSAACGAVRKRGDCEAEYRGHCEAVAAFELAAQKQLASLVLWRGSLAELPQVAVPLLESVERADRERTALEQESRRGTEKDRELEAELNEIHREIQALQDSESVPTEADLIRQRDERNQAWLDLRNALSDPGRARVAKARECAAFEALVAAADTTADRLRREAGRVQKLAHLRARKHDLETRRARLAKDLRDGQRRTAGFDTDWRALWAPCGIQPLSPREMLAWLNHFAEVQRSAEKAAEATALRDRCQAWMLEQAEGLRECLRELRELDEHASGQSLAVLMGQAERLIEAEADKLRQRRRLLEDIERLSGEIMQAQQAESAANESLAAWQDKWAAAMDELGCPAEATSEQANQRIARLDEMFDCVDEARLLESRIREIEKEGVDFEQRVADLVARIAPDLIDEPAVHAAGQLQQRLEAARTASQEHARLAEEIHRAKTELEHARPKQQSLQASLARFCELAGVDDTESLPEVEQSSSKYRACREKLAAIEEQLRELGAGMAIEEMVREAAERDVDQLDARLAQLATEIESLERTRDEQTSRSAELQNQSDATDGRARAAEADGCALGILSRMHDDATRFLKLRLAAVMLRQQIERHRSENEDPILAKASDYFARITCDEFRGLRTEYASDEAVIVGLRRNDQLVDVEAMSTGTRDQLFLALRLAYLERRLEQHEPLPFIVDDVLIHFDDERAGATLEVLAEVARQTQVILFTHHQRITDLAESRLSKGTYFVHQLHQGKSLHAM